MDESPDEEKLQLLREHREFFERLALSDLPISADAARGPAYLEAEAEAND